METTGIETATAKPPELRGIAGWLLLPAIGLAVGPVFLGIALALLPLYVLGAYPEGEPVEFGSSLGLELAVGFVQLLVITYAAARFFKKKRNAPAAVCAVLLLQIAIECVWYLAELESPLEVDENGTVSRVEAVLAAAIWIPYFRVSKRVKATFVE